MGMRALGTAERRRQIVEVLRSTSAPATGGQLAARLGVSRQIIVQDVAVLRAAGEEIVATPQGYAYLRALGPGAHRAVVACRHTPEQTEEELLVLVDHGVTVVDVVVEHPLYGELRGLLMLESREDVRGFLQKVKETHAVLLSALTQGVHLHTVESSRPGNIERAKEELARRAFLLGDT